MRSRKRKSPEEVSASRRAAVMKRHHPELFKKTSAKPKPETVGDKPPLPGVCSYDLVVIRPTTYQDAVQREKAIAEEIENENRRNEALVRRGQLFTKDQVSDRDNAWNKAAADEAEKVQRLIDSIEGITPTQRKTYLDRFRDWRKGMNEAMSKVLK